MVYATQHNPKKKKKNGLTVWDFHDGSESDMAEHVRTRKTLPCRGHKFVHWWGRPPVNAVHEAKNQLDGHITLPF